MYAYTNSVKRKEKQAARAPIITAILFIYTHYCFISNSVLVSDKSRSWLNPRPPFVVAHRTFDRSVPPRVFFFDGVVPIVVVVGRLISSVSAPTTTPTTTTTTYTRARALSFGIPEARQLLGTNRTGSPETAERRKRTNPENGGEC